MAGNDETRVGGLPRLFRVDSSWYERYWWQESAPRRPGIFAFFRRIFSQLRLARRQDVRTVTHLQMKATRPNIAP
jgi:hypothetical protein